MSEDFFPKRPTEEPTFADEPAGAEVAHDPTAPSQSFAELDPTDPPAKTVDADSFADDKSQILQESVMAHENPAYPTSQVPVEEIFATEPLATSEPTVQIGAAPISAAPLVGVRVLPRPPLHQEPVQERGFAPVRSTGIRYTSFWPLILFGGSFLSFLGWQYTEQVKATTQLTQAKTQREVQVTAAKKVQTDLQSVATDLLELAKTNDKAKSVIDKYQVKQTPPVK